MEKGNPKVINSADPRLYRKLYEAAKRMRKEPTIAEQIVWEALKNTKTDWKFRRQHIISRFIADFYCVETGLIVEIDGDIHKDRVDLDNERDKILTSLGCTILRFSNVEVKQDLDHVIANIISEQTKLKNLSPRL